MSNYYSALKWGLRYATAVALIGLPRAAMAATTGLPWESPLQKIQSSISGPVVAGVSVIVMVLAGLAFALGEGGSVMRRAAGAVLGLSVAIGATAFITTLFGGTGNAALFP